MNGRVEADPADGVGLWGRLVTCGGLATRLPTLACGPANAD
jgi:hypothetical protein